MRKRILSIMPEHCTYVEPFAGGASIFFAKAPARKEVLGDMSAPLVGFLKGTAKGGLRKCNYTHNRATFDRLKAKYRSGKKLTPCEYFIMNKISFAGIMRGFAPDKAVAGKKQANATKVFARLDEFESRLRHAKIVRQDFAKVMKQNDSPCAVHFVDPPYERAVSKGTLKSMYNSGAEPERVHDVARRMKGKVIITYGDHPDIRKLFCGRGSKFRCYQTDMGYSINKDAGAGGETKWKSAKELVITNFDVPKTPGLRILPKK